MKKSTVLILILTLVLCACGAQPVETTPPPVTQEPATLAVTQAPEETAPAEVPTEPPTDPPAVYTNPLTGESLAEPMDSRSFAVTVNNVPGAMPMYGVSKADLFFEMFVNDYCTRGLAIYADIREVGSVGSVRSLRYNFTDLCQTYDAIVAHASGSSQVMADLAASGVANVNVEGEGSGYYYRDQNRIASGYPWEHCLFVKGADLRAYAEGKGTRVTRQTDADYGLRFAQDGTPDGQPAEKITVYLKHDGASKQTILEYSAEEGKYLFHQYGQAMYDGSEKQNIYFENVIVMLCNVYNDGVYHVAELTGSGGGFFACGGKIIPIRWSHESMEAPILFTLEDGTPLKLGVGSSYIAIAPLASTVVWE